MTKDEFMAKFGWDKDGEAKAWVVINQMRKQEEEYFSRHTRMLEEKFRKNKEKERIEFIENWEFYRDELNTYKSRYLTLVKNIQDSKFYDACINIEFWENQDDE